MLKGNGYKVGNIGYSAECVQTLSSKQKSIGILNGRVYDMTAYVTGGRHQQVRAGEEQPTDLNAVNFMDQLVVDLFQQRAGEDVSKLWDALKLDTTTKKAMMALLG